jgi:hypothetical protein
MIRDPESFNILLDTLTRFVREKLIPRETEVTETDEIPADIVDDMRKLGMFGLTIPEEYGGLGLTTEEEVLTSMAVCYASPVFRSRFGTNTGIGSQGIVIDGSEEQKKKYLPRLAAGEITGSRLRCRLAAHHGAPRRRPLRHQRQQALHHQRARSGHFHADGTHRPEFKRRKRRVGFHRRTQHTGADRRALRPQDGPARFTYC